VDPNPQPPIDSVRAILFPHVRVPKPLHPAGKGFIIGICNLVVVSAAIAGTVAGSSEGTVQAFVLIGMLAFVPAIVTGTVVGWIAGAIAHLHRAIRITILLPLSVGAVASLGHLFDMDDLILPSCIPTLVAVMILERWTRPTVANPLPDARIA
jgi:hypothetical protein